jgi:hypothetical protein
VEIESGSLNASWARLRVQMRDRVNELVRTFPLGIFHRREDYDHDLKRKSDIVNERNFTARTETGFIHNAMTQLNEASQLVRTTKINNTLFVI